MTATIEIELFTDPACPFAFSAEPVRRRLRWLYGDALSWRPRMIVLTLEPGEAEKLAEGAPGLQRRYGMPIAPEPYRRPASCAPACRAVVATRRRAPAAAEALLRTLRVRTMAGGLLDDPALIDGAAADVGLDPRALRAWCAEPETERELAEDVAAARSPSPAARALGHKLGGPEHERRYSAPSYELRRSDGTATASVPGFNPAAVYEAVIANLAPELDRADPPDSVAALLRWARAPLATAEVLAIMDGDEQSVRAELARCADPLPFGADFYWVPRG
ncbi:MAG TPA: DsbA family protein [Solirubrobacteraceae bacterium]|nr:DsbA family protein [Solirubrobacteraceae bacterium]